MPVVEETTLYRQEDIVVPEQQRPVLPTRPELAFLAVGIEHKADALSNKGYDLPDPLHIGQMSDSLTQDEAKAFTGNGKKDIFTVRLELLDKVDKLLTRPDAETIIQRLAEEHPDQAELLEFFRSPAAREDPETGKVSKKPAIEIYRQQVLADQAAAKSQGRMYGR